MLYSLKKEVGSLAERKDPGLEERNQEQAVDQSVTPTDADENRLDPLEGLDEATKICFLVLFGWATGGEHLGIGKALFASCGSCAGACVLQSSCI